MKKHIAIFMPGGVGGGYYSQGIPVIAKLVDDLSVEHTICIYSVHPPNADFIPQTYQLFSVSKAIHAGWLRWILLSLLFLKHHFDKRYDLLYAFWGIPAGVLVTFLSKLVRRPSVIHLQGGDAVYIPSVKYGSLKGFLKMLMLWAYNHCSVLIALTRFQETRLIEAGVSRSIEVIPFGPDVSLFPRKEKANLHSPIRFLHVGNLLPVKDQRTLLNTFALIAKTIPAQLRIIGEDHLHGLIQDHCRELKMESSVEFIGIQPYDQMPVHYAWADVVVMTSVYEGQCLAVSEAAASGVLLAGTRVGILSDWDHRCAIVSEPGNAAQLASRMIAAFNNADVMHDRIDKAWNEVVQKDRQWTFFRVSECIHKALNPSLR